METKTTNKVNGTEHFAQKENYRIVKKATIYQIERWFDEEECTRNAIKQVNSKEGYIGKLDVKKEIYYKHEGGEWIPILSHTFFTEEDAEAYIDYEVERNADDGKHFGKVVKTFFK